MSHKLRIALGVVGAIVATLVIVAGLIQVLTLDGLTGLVFGRLSPDTTEYSAGYTESAFKKVRLGMTEQEVTALLGPPIKVAAVSGNRSTWVYSVSRTKGNYYVRSVIFDNGRVEETFHEFYVD